MNRHFQIQERMVGEGQPCFVIAEAGVNHNGRLATALKLVATAASAGADAVKFQTFRASEIAAASAPCAAYQQTHSGRNSTQRSMLRKLELSRADFLALSRECEALGIRFLSTPFDFSSADLLNELGVWAFKISSGDMNNHPFLEHVASFRKPMIVSTGMANLAEVKDAVDCLKGAGCNNLVLLHCVSCYPAPPNQANLRAMDRLREEFNVPVGYSDHTLGDAVAVAAVARGACVIEKHLTLRRSMTGPDHAASMTPAAFAILVKRIREIESSLGNGEKSPVEAEANVAAVARKSIHAARNIAVGEIIGPEMLSYLRPAGGIPPDAWRKLLGRRVLEPLSQGERIRMDVLA